MSQPIQYSNLFFETDPNNLAAKLVQNDRNTQTNSRENPNTRTPSQQWSQGDSIARQNGSNERSGGTGFRPPPRFEGFDDISSQASTNVNTRLTSTQNSHRQPSENRSQRVLSRTWDLATAYGQTPSKLTQFSNQNRSITATPIRTLPNASQTARGAIPSELLSQEIGPRHCSTSAATQTSSLAELLNQGKGAYTEATPGRNYIAASHAPTFRPPRPAVSNPPKDNTSSSLAASITNYFQVKASSNDESAGTEFQTSAWFDGLNERMERNTIPGPAVDAWVLADEMETQCDYSQRDFNERKERTVEDLPKYGRSGIFSKGPWLAFCYSFDQPPVLDSDCPKDCLLRKYNCDGILRGELGSNAEKVPFLALIAIKIRFFEHYATATLADPTGDIEAEIHQDVLRTSQWSIQEGAVLVLRQITICRPLFLGEEVSTHTIIITSSNVERVFPCNEPVPDAFISSLPRIISDQNQPRFGKASSANLSASSPVVIEHMASYSTRSHAGFPCVTTLPTVIPQPSHIAPKRGRYVEADFQISDEEEEEELFDINEGSKANKQVSARSSETGESPIVPSSSPTPNSQPINTPIVVRTRLEPPKQAGSSPIELNSNKPKEIIGAVDDLFNDSPVSSVIPQEKETVIEHRPISDAELPITKPSSVPTGTSQTNTTRVQPNASFDDIGWLDD